MVAAPENAVLGYFGVASDIATAIPAFFVVTGLMSAMMLHRKKGSK